MSMSFKASPDGTFGEILVNGQVVAKLPVTGNAVIPGLVGTVSQSGGVPTGAVVERGSNANGDYVRFADGTQICATQTVITTANAFNNVFGSTSGTSYRNLFNWTYPAAFSAQPIVSAGTANVASPTEFSAVLPTSAIVLAYSTANGTAISTFCFAIGRWF